MKRVNSVYVLHVSDFHVSKESEKDATDALAALTSKLQKENICISYLIHTGDIINSSDLEQEITQQYGSFVANDENAERYNELLKPLVSERFESATKIMKMFIGNLGVSNKNVIICCGNHDKVRFHKKEKESFSFFEKFLNNQEITVHKELTTCIELDDVKVLVLNTNYSNDKKVTCIDCDEVNKILESQLQLKKEKQTGVYGCEKNKKNSAINEKRNKVNIIVAHQPLYDVCEYARLPYSNESQTTDFLSALQEFIKGNGIYLCGDKHTSSIAASYIHDIPHYFCGHPFVFKEMSRPVCCTKKGNIISQKKEIEYNLIEIREGKIGEIKKLHLSHNTDKWECEIHPIDTVVADLYEKSRKYIVQNSFTLIASKSRTRYNSLNNLSWHNLSKRLDDIINSQEILQEISDFYRLFCNLKGRDWEENILRKSSTKHIFEQLNDIIDFYFNSDENIKNIINIRGDYSSGKSTFLGFMYMYLLYCYSHGKINYIPAYFNMENNAISSQIQEGKDYSSAVQRIFSSFVEDIEKIAKLEQVPVCYIIDGLDEQDIWSESSKDSIGRVIVDILEETKNSKYIMSFCQNNLAKFKNTMPSIKFYEKSYVMYFNSIAVKEKEKEKEKFYKFVRFFIELYDQSPEDEKQICDAINKLRRLTVNAGFIHHNYEYLKSCSKNDSNDTVYMRYIENQHRICLNDLEYNFIHYAPAMAYLFSYEGYTYENFKNIPPNPMNYFEKKIVEYSTKIYDAFVFIKKHKDAREYLIALHYNRALRYFAENPKEEIPENSILNKIISRNVSIIIREQWKNDQNKFVIVCRDLIKRRKKNGQIALGKSTLSMLIYIWTYLDKIPFGTNEELEKILLHSDDELTSWEISTEGLKMKQFIDLNYLHSKEIFYAIKSKNSVELVSKMLNDEYFLLYNRQYMMWYYGDLTIYGRNKVNNLIPGNDALNKGLDYYWCFYMLYQKICDSLEVLDKPHYPLLAFDLFTMFDLVFSRTSKIYKSEKNTYILYSIYNLCKKTQECLKRYVDVCDISVIKGKNKKTVYKKTKKNDSDKDVIYLYQAWIKQIKEQNETENVSVVIQQFFKTAELFMGNIIKYVEPQIGEIIKTVESPLLEDNDPKTLQNMDNTEEQDCTTTIIQIKGEPEIELATSYGTDASVKISVEGENLSYTWYYQNPGDNKFLESVTKYVDENKYRIPIRKENDGQKVYCVIKDDKGNTDCSQTVELSLKVSEKTDVCN